MTNETADSENLVLSEEEVKARKSRNLILALVLVAFVFLIAGVTMVRLQSADLGPDGGLYYRMDSNSSESGVVDPDFVPPESVEPINPEASDE